MWVSLEGGSTNFRLWVWIFSEIFHFRRVWNSVRSHLMTIITMLTQWAELQVWTQCRNTSMSTTICYRRLTRLTSTFIGLWIKLAVSQLCLCSLFTLCADFTLIPIPTWMKPSSAVSSLKFTKATGGKLSIIMTFTQQMCFRWPTSCSLKAIWCRSLSWMS